MRRFESSRPSAVSCGGVLGDAAIARLLAEMTQSPCLGMAAKSVVSATCLSGVFLVSRFREPKSTESEGGALISPVEGNASQEQLDCQGARLAALDDGFHDVGSQISKP